MVEKIQAVEKDIVEKYRDSGKRYRENETNIDSKK